MPVKLHDVDGIEHMRPPAPSALACFSPDIILCVRCCWVAASFSPVAASAIVQETDLYDPRTQWASYLINALKAKELQKRNVNYIVRGEEVLVHRCQQAKLAWPL